MGDGRRRGSEGRGGAGRGKEAGTGTDVRKGDVERDDRPLGGGGHEVDKSVGGADKVHAADKKATPTKGHNLVIWVFIALLLAAIVFVAIGALVD